jgi:predicted transglutaminase-like cysteine proteinase
MWNNKAPHTTALILAAFVTLAAGPQDGLAHDAAGFRVVKADSNPSAPGQTVGSSDNLRAVRSIAPALLGTDELFASSTLRVTGEPLELLWQTVKSGILADMASLARCRAKGEMCSHADRMLLRIIAEGRSHDGLGRLGVVNRAINLIIKPKDNPYAWQSPLETLSAGEGDCKDYAVAKYLALLEAGVAEQDLRLVIVHETAINEKHAIVAVRFNGDWLVLDNRWLALVRDIDFPHAVPLYALDENGVWRFGQQAARSNAVTKIGYTN